MKKIGYFLDKLLGPALFIIVLDEILIEGYNITNTFIVATLYISRFILVAELLYRILHYIVSKIKDK